MNKKRRNMKIVIIGDGKVGYKLAGQLSFEQYDVVLIDSNERKLRSAIDRLDIFCVQGDGVNAEIQKEADVPHADLVIACTSADECNMLACLVARKLGARHTIARVRNPVYFHQMDMLREDLRLSMVVNPELIVAGEISRLLIFPEASKIETFVKGRVELLEHFVAEGSSLVGKSLAQLYQSHQVKVLVCAIERKSKVFIPSGDSILEAGDRLHITGMHRDMERFFKLIGFQKNKIRKVLVCGGGMVSLYLCSRLLNLGMQVKIIERDEKRCDMLCEQLPRATIIHGDASDHDLLMEEDIHEADAFVALTGMDEENIITSLFAKSQGVGKIVVKINEDRRAKMIEDFGIDSIVSQKTATADVIMSYVRARHNSRGSANVETMYQLVDGEVEALEFIIRKQTRYTDVPLKQLRIKSNHLIACIARGKQIIIPNGDDCIRVGDSVIIVALNKQLKDIEEMIE